MADEKKILKMYNDLTPNEKHLVGVFVKAMILSRNKNDRQSWNSISKLELYNGQITKTHRLIIYVNIIPQKGTKINANCN